MKQAIHVGASRFYCSEKLLFPSSYVVHLLSPVSAMSSGTNLIFLTCQHDTEYFRYRSRQASVAESLSQSCDASLY